MVGMGRTRSLLPCSKAAALQSPLVGECLTSGNGANRSFLTVRHKGRKSDAIQSLCGVERFDLVSVAYIVHMRPDGVESPRFDAITHPVKSLRFARFASATTTWAAANGLLIITLPGTPWAGQSAELSALT